MNLSDIWLDGFLLVATRREKNSKNVFILLIALSEQQQRRSTIQRHQYQSSAKRNKRRIIQHEDCNIVGETKQSCFVVSSTLGSFLILCNIFFRLFEPLPPLSHKNRTHVRFLFFFSKCQKFQTPQERYVI